jgi:hypothetical protein
MRLTRELSLRVLLCLLVFSEVEGRLDSLEGAVAQMQRRPTLPAPPPRTQPTSEPQPETAPAPAPPSRDDDDDDDDGWSDEAAEDWEEPTTSGAFDPPPLLLPLPRPATHRIHIHYDCRDRAAAVSID